MNAARAPRGDTTGPFSFLRAPTETVVRVSRRSALTRVELVLIAVVTIMVAGLVYLAYHTQRVRAQVDEGLAVAKAVAPLVADTIRRLDALPPELAAAIPMAFEKGLAGSVVESVTVVDGRIDVVFSAAADAAIAGRRLSLTPFETADLEIVWLCGNATPGPGLNPLGFAQGAHPPMRLPSTIDARYLAAPCR